jgi:hypothetical protein
MGRSNGKGSCVNFKRRCTICETPLSGRKGHGFITSSGVICGDYKRHQRIKRTQKKRQLLDKEVEEMLVFNLEVSDKDNRLLMEVTD